MPITLPGLQEAGLSNWPTWYRAMNPGYFASESMGIRRRRDRLSRETLRQISKMGEDVRSAAGLASLTVAGVVPGERLRTPNRRLTSDRNVKREDLGEQIISRLRGMSVKLKEEQAEKMLKAKKVAELNTPTALIERAAAMDAKDWEEESGLVGDDRDSDVSVGKSKVEKAKGKLVDV